MEEEVKGNIVKGTDFDTSILTEHGHRTAITAVFKSDQGPIFRCSFNASDFVELDKSRHDTIKEAWQAHMRMIDPANHDIANLWFSVFIYVHDDGHWWAETMISNASMHDAIGFVSGDYLVFLGDKLVIQANGGELYDQTAWVELIGKPRLAPDLVKLEKLCVNCPNDVNFSAETLYWWGKIDPRGEDHIYSTHQTGSPRNKYFAWEEHGVYQFYVRQRDQFPEEDIQKLAIPILAFAHEQLGTTYKNEEDIRVFHPGRPYHLFDFSSGKPCPYDPRISYQVDYSGNEYHPSRFYEGVIRLRQFNTAPYGWNIETFGRRHLPIVDRSAPKSLWGFSRLTGFIYSGDQLVTGSPFNGGDYEHFATERLANACICTPSEVARLSLRCLLNTFFTVNGNYGTNCEGWVHSSRTLGWWGRAALRGKFVFDDNWYLSRARRMVVLFNSRDYEELFFNKPGMHSDSALHYAFTREQKRAADAWDSGFNPNEACWQAAVAAMFFWLGYEQDPDIDWKEKWKEAALYVSECLGYTYQPFAGWAENFRTRFLGNDGEVITEGDVTYLSTRHWVLDPVAMALAVTEDEDKYGYVREAWNVLKGRTRYPYFNIGSEHASSWHRYCMKFLGTENMQIAGIETEGDQK